MELTAQQKAILDQAKPPFELSGIVKGQAQQTPMVRITAAAGTGKTTTLVFLAKRLKELGHSQITFVTFSRCSARDAVVKMNDMKLCNVVEVKTVHACAMASLANMDEEDYLNGGRYHFPPEDNTFQFIDDDHHCNKLVLEICESDIHNFLGQVYECIELRHRGDPTKIRANKHRCVQKVIYFIRKTFTKYCQSNKANVPEYYPVKKFFEHCQVTKSSNKPETQASKMGFPPVYKTRMTFFVEEATRLFDYCREHNITSHDIRMKKAQLAKLKIPCTVLLVDECQDMDECQLDWVMKQHRFGTAIFAVGDAAQQIYSWRGANSRNLLNMSGAVDLKLTKSFRFGEGIGRVANSVLFMKENSPQTTGLYNKYRRWVPYRVQAVNHDPGVVTNTSLLETDKPYTILAWRNATLLMRALGILAKSSNSGRALKIHINSGGKGSGLGPWKRVITEIEDIFHLFMNQNESHKLPESTFSFWGGEYTNWDTFVRDVHDNEDLVKYVRSIEIISKYEEDTMQCVNQFRQEIVEKKYSADEADVTISTCHAAKGMEWDNVELCDDFVDVSKMKIGKGHGEFDFRQWGDDVNLLYVACTRAKRILSIPSSLCKVFKIFDSIHDALSGQMDRGYDCFISNNSANIRRVCECLRESLRKEPKDISVADINAIWESLCKPLRKELGVNGIAKLSEFIFSPLPTVQKKRPLPTVVTPEKKARKMST